MRTFAANGGNCMRLWLGHASVEVEPVQVGVFDREKTETLRGIVRLAEELGIRLKLTLESFRACAFDPKAPPSVFMRPAYANLAKDFGAFFGTPECRAAYLNRAYAIYPGDSNAVTFCQANFKLMGADLIETARHFGTRIAFVHVRDVAGDKTDFTELFHDQGTTDQFALMRTYRALGLDVPIRGDHVPEMEGDRLLAADSVPGYSTMGRLFANGYLTALMKGTKVVG